MARRADNPEQPAEPDPAPTPPAGEPGEPHEPEWARQLRRTLDELPGKLRASLTDDDRRSIAESVHDFFERSGAFRHDEPPPADPPEEPAANEPPAPASDAPPHKPTWAERIGFPQY